MDAFAAMPGAVLSHDLAQLLLEPGGFKVDALLSGAEAPLAGWPDTNSDAAMAAAERWLGALDATGHEDLAASLVRDYVPGAQQTQPARSCDQFALDDDTEQVTNKPQSRAKHSGGRQKAPALTLDDVRRCQHMSLKDAAKTCGTGTTQFKIQCRKLGVMRWNYRKLQSLAVLETHLREHAERERRPDGTVPETLVEWNLRVQDVKARVYDDPTGTAGKEITVMLQELEGLRQWDVKYHYNNRKRAAGAAVQPATPRLVPKAPGNRAQMQAVAQARVAGRRKAASHDA